MREGWSTVEELRAAQERFEAALDWQRPAAHGIAVGPAEDPVFRRANAGERWLPAVILATVLGHRGGSRAYPLGVAQLDRAIALLAPAAACTAVDHPNLAAWHALRAELDLDGVATVVFADDLATTSPDPYVRALLAVLAR